MELKIWVEGIQRIVCGVTVNTTCQEVVFALANATGKVGRFTLIERWRNNERLLAPTENPLKLLLKWGEYASDVQFILQRSEQINRVAAATSDDKGQLQQSTKKQPPASISSDLKPQQPMQLQQQQQQNLQKQADNYTPLNQCKELRKSFGSQTAKSIDNVGNFPGVKQHNIPSQPTSTPPQPSVKHEKSPSNLSMPSLPSASDPIFNYFPENPSIEINPKKPLISSNGALVPPPYRDPPPPRNSPMQLQQQNQSRLLKYSTDVGNNVRTNSIPSMDFNENSFQTAQYKDLRQLIKFQRDKITSQQSELTKYDAEIVDLENKERDQAQDLEAISREITKSDYIFRQGSEQLQTLQYVVEDNELVKQQGKTLKSEIKLLRSKLANCETELLQCKNKMRILMDDIQAEHKAISIQQMDDRQNVKRDFLIEMERIQIEIDQAIHATDSSSLAIDHLKKEINMIENAIADKKRQVEQLVNEMKEVNLQSLAVKPSDEICSLLEGSTKTGSSRRIIGSPRQLENAVPTKKNPHGVWV